MLTRIKAWWWSIDGVFQGIAGVFALLAIALAAGLSQPMGFAAFLMTGGLLLMGTLGAIIGVALATGPSLTDRPSSIERSKGLAIGIFLTGSTIFTGVFIALAFASR